MVCDVLPVLKHRDSNTLSCRGFARHGGSVLPAIGGLGVWLRFGVPGFVQAEEMIQSPFEDVVGRFQASAAKPGARRPWFLSDAKSFGFHGFSLGSWLLWLSLPVLLALMVVAFLCSCGFCLWLSLAWDCLVLIGFDGWRCFFPFVAVPGAERPFIRIF